MLLLHYWRHERITSPSANIANRAEADLSAIAGSGFIPIFDSLVRTALDAGPEYGRVLLPPMPMPNLTTQAAQVE